jgi:hypothetical protein
MAQSGGSDATQLEPALAALGSALGS